MIPLPAETVARFCRDTDALIGGPLGDDKLLVAVSGGADSLALLLLAHTACDAGVYAATVDHGLRAANADEARFVAALCAGFGIHHAVLSASERCSAGVSSRQAAARDLRYHLLAQHAERVGCRWLATGHHRDDQAETLLMRMARGSGLPGLASIRTRRGAAPVAGSENAVELVRPLLGWTRASLATIVDAAGLTPVDDPSNRSPDYDRTRFRTLLAGTPLLDPARLAASAAHLGECEDALAWTEAREWDARAQVDDGRRWRVDVAGLPRELRRRLVVRAIDEARRNTGLAAEWRRDGVGRLLDLLDVGRRATLGGIKCSGGSVWRFEAAPLRRPGANRS